MEAFLPMSNQDGINCAEIIKALDLVVWFAEGEANLIRLDGPVERLLGWESQQRDLTIETLLELLHPSDRQVFTESFERHSAGESPVFSCEFRLRQGDGTYRWMMDRGLITHRDPEGTPAVVVGVWIDIHERKVAELLAYASSAQTQTLDTLLREAINALPEGIVIYDDHDRLTFWNSAVEDIYDGLLDGPMGGRTFEELYLTEVRLGAHPEALGRERAWVDEILARRRAGDTEEEFRLRDGRRIRAQDKLLANGYRVGLRIDITQIMLERERLAAILDGANLATWEWDAASGAAEVNDCWYDLFETDRSIRGEDLTRSFQAHLDPEDKARLDDAVRAHFRGESERIDIQVNAKTARGTALVLLLRGRGVQRMPDGRYRRLSGVMIDVTTLRAVPHYLERARRHAVAESTAKTELLVRLNHEIRTPLNAVLGTISLLEARMGDHESEEDRKLIALASQSGAQLNGLLDDLLELGQISPNSPAELAEIRPEAIGAMIRAGYETRAKARGLTLDVLVDATSRRAGQGYPRRIVQILDHIVGNALEHTANGTVEVRLRLPEPETLQMEVLDQGPGIPTEALHRVFEPLDQPLGNARSDTDGMGLGLAYVRQLVASLDGDINIEGRVNGGTRVRVRLPLAPATDEEPDVQAPADVPRLDGLRVLVAEDIADGRLLLERMLTRLGAEAVLVEDGQAALVAMKQQRFDVAVFDIRMPGLDGMETLHLARVWETETRQLRLPILAMSASTMAHEVDRYIAAGFLAVLAKPIRLRTLADMLSPFMRLPDQDSPPL